MTGLISEGLIETAARRAVKEVPQKILDSLRKKEPSLEFQVKGETFENQKEEIQRISGDFRYDFVLTPYNGQTQIVCGCPKEEVLPHFVETLQKYGDFRAEIWQGKSEASMEELRRAYW